MHSESRGRDATGRHVRVRAAGADEASRRAHLHNLEEVAEGKVERVERQHVACKRAVPTEEPIRLRAIDVLDPEAQVSSDGRHQAFLRVVDERPHERALHGILRVGPSFEATLQAVLTNMQLLL